ncbi:hypothetical protein Bca4012_010022 [Brassica carinata]
MLQEITKVCCELSDLRDAVENMCDDMHIKYLTFLSVMFCLVLYEIHFLCLVLCIISIEAVEMEHEFILKIDEVGELFEEARGTLNKNVFCMIKELNIYNSL